MFEWRMHLNSLYQELLVANQQQKLDFLREVEKLFPKEINAELPKVIVLTFSSHYDNTLVEETLAQIGYAVDSYVETGVIATLVE